MLMDMDITPTEMKNDNDNDNDNARPQTPTTPPFPTNGFEHRTPPRAPLKITRRIKLYDYIEEYGNTCEKHFLKIKQKEKQD